MLSIYYTNWFFNYLLTMLKTNIRRIVVDSHRLDGIIICDSILRIRKEFHDNFEQKSLCIQH